MMRAPEVRELGTCRRRKRGTGRGALWVTPSLLVLCAGQTLAADLTDTCCADLEARIAELETMAARPGRRTFEIELSGAVNRAILAWDDGSQRNVYTVTNDNDNSVATIEGETGERASGWTVGFVLDFDVLDAGSSDVDQREHSSTRSFEIGELSVWLKNEWLGQVSIGKTSARGASSGASEQDLSGTEVAGYSGVTDVGGSFLLRRKDIQGARGLLNARWDDVIDSLDEPDGNVVTYSSPEFSGASFSALWGEDDVWNVAAGYHSVLWSAFQVAAAIAVNENLQGEADDLPDHRTVSGSISVLHQPSGLNLTLAGGRRSFIENFEMVDGLFGSPPSSYFVYTKLGWQAPLIDLGTTALFAEYGRFGDVLGARADAGQLRELGCDQAPSCFASASRAQVLGLGVVQSIDDTEAKLYLSYRHFEADFELSGPRGERLSAIPLADLDTILAGMLIEF